ncbi:hypothetical protein D3C71_1436080 [compost metagenome]
MHDDLGIDERADRDAAFALGAVGLGDFNPVPSGFAAGLAPVRLAAGCLAANPQLDARRRLGGSARRVRGLVLAGKSVEVEGPAGFNPCAADDIGIDEATDHAHGCLSERARRNRPPLGGGGGGSEGKLQGDLGDLFIGGAVAACEERGAHRVGNAERRTRAVLEVVATTAAEAVPGFAQVLREQSVIAPPCAALRAAEEEGHYAAAFCAALSGAVFAASYWAMAQTTAVMDHR